MRRAVIGILISNDPSPIDILDVLTEYAAHLALTRRPLDALALYARLEPIYKGAVAKHNLKYIRFTARYLQTLTTVGGLRDCRSHTRGSILFSNGSRAVARF
jgi:hypothetical protein